MKYLLVKSSKNAHGSTMKHLTRKNFEKIKFPKYTIERQEKIANILNQTSSLIQTRKDQIQALDNLVESVFYEILNKNEYENDIGHYDHTNLSFGIMFNGFIYPKKIEGKLKSTFTHIEMKKGRINFIKAEECKIINELNEYSFKFSNKIKSVDEELIELGEGYESTSSAL